VRILYRCNRSTFFVLYLLIVQASPSENPKTTIRLSSHLDASIIPCNVIDPLRIHAAVAFDSHDPLDGFFHHTAEIRWKPTRSCRSRTDSTMAPKVDKEYQSRARWKSPRTQCTATNVVNQLPLSPKLTHLRAQDARKFASSRGSDQKQPRTPRK
jgi:hypothetical protein